ncbi:MAG: glycosyltransferase family 2 protein [Cellvibrionaceae bacterium]|nr:glycosyltransferase family 2 protein [Cellvibrionaceae bacterium]
MSEALSPVKEPVTDRPAESLSVVIPFYNEAGNILPLLREAQAALAQYPGDWELIVVNDGSRDSTEQELEAARRELGTHIYPIHFARNFGQTAAMQAGIEVARGDLIVTLDGDGQNDPGDIPAMIDYLHQQDLDMVAGWRKNRQDGRINRKLPSKIANWIIRKATGVTVQDYGCSLKLYRATVIKQVVLMGEMHRFIPAWVASVTDPRRIGQLAVNHRARTIGESKYGISRTIRVVLDLLSVMFFMRFSRRPGHFFGSLGLASGLLGSVILSYLLLVKIIQGADIGGRPLLFVGILLVTAGIQLVTTGVLAEMQTRNAPSPSYPVKQAEAVSERVWYQADDPR